MSFKVPPVQRSRKQTNLDARHLAPLQPNAVSSAHAPTATQHPNANLLGHPTRSLHANPSNLTFHGAVTKLSGHTACNSLNEVRKRPIVSLGAGVHSVPLRASEKAASSLVKRKTHHGQVAVGSQQQQQQQQQHLAVSSPLQLHYTHAVPAVAQLTRSVRNDLCFPCANPVINKKALDPTSIFFLMHRLQVEAMGDNPAESPVYYFTMRGGDGRIEATDDLDVLSLAVVPKSVVKIASIHPAAKTEVEDTEEDTSHLTPKFLYFRLEKSLVTRLLMFSSAAPRNHPITSFASFGSGVTDDSFERTPHISFEDDYYSYQEFVHECVQFVSLRKISFFQTRSRLKGVFDVWRRASRAHECRRSAARLIDTLPYLQPHLHEAVFGCRALMEEHLAGLFFHRWDASNDEMPGLAMSSFAAHTALHAGVCVSRIRTLREGVVHVLYNGCRAWLCGMSFNGADLLTLLERRLHHVHSHGSTTPHSDVTPTNKRRRSEDIDQLLSNILSLAEEGEASETTSGLSYAEMGFLDAHLVRIHRFIPSIGFMLFEGVRGVAKRSASALYEDLAEQTLFGLEVLLVTTTHPRLHESGPVSGNAFDAEVLINTPEGDENTLPAPHHLVPNPAVYIEAILTAIDDTVQAVEKDAPTDLASSPHLAQFFPNGAHTNAELPISPMSPPIASPGVQSAGSPSPSPSPRSVESSGSEVGGSAAPTPRASASGAARNKTRDFRRNQITISTLLEGDTAYLATQNAILLRLRQDANEAEAYCTSLSPLLRRYLHCCKEPWLFLKRWGDVRTMEETTSLFADQTANTANTTSTETHRKSVSQQLTRILHSGVLEEATQVVESLLLLWGEVEGLPSSTSTGCFAVDTTAIKVVMLRHICTSVVQMESSLPELLRVSSTEMDRILTDLCDRLSEHPDTTEGFKDLITAGVEAARSVESVDSAFSRTRALSELISGLEGRIRAHPTLKEMKEAEAENKKRHAAPRSPRRRQRNAVQNVMADPEARLSLAIEAAATRRTLFQKLLASSEENRDYNVACYNRLFAATFCEMKASAAEVHDALGQPDLDDPASKVSSSVYVVQNLETQTQSLATRLEYHNNFHAEMGLQLHTLAFLPEARRLISTKKRLWEMLLSLQNKVFDWENMECAAIDMQGFEAELLTAKAELLAVCRESKAQEEAEREERELEDDGQQQQQQQQRPQTAVEPTHRLRRAIDRILEDHVELAPVISTIGSPHILAVHQRAIGAIMDVDALTQLQRVQLQRKSMRAPSNQGGVLPTADTVPQKTEMETAVERFKSAIASRSSSARPESQEDAANDDSDDEGNASRKHSGLTVRELKMINAKYYLHSVVEVWGGAIRQAKVRRIFDREQAIWVGAELQLSTFTGATNTTFQVLAGLPDISERCDHSISVATCLLESDAADDIRRQLETFLNICRSVQDVVAQLHPAQNFWMKNEFLFSSQEMQRAIGEQKVFTEYDKGLRDLIRRFTLSGLNFFNALRNEGPSDVGRNAEGERTNSKRWLRSGVAKLQNWPDLGSKISNYVLQRRNEFYRLCLLSDREVLDISASPYRLPPIHVISTLLGGGIGGLTQASEAEGHFVVGTTSCLGEAVSLRTPVRVRGSFEKWLPKLEESIQETLKAQVGDAYLRWSRPVAPSEEEESDLDNTTKTRQSVFTFGASMEGRMPADIRLSVTGRERENEREQRSVPKEKGEHDAGGGSVVSTGSLSSPLCVPPPRHKRSIARGSCIFNSAMQAQVSPPAVPALPPQPHIPKKLLSPTSPSSCDSPFGEAAVKDVFEQGIAQQRASVYEKDEKEKEGEKEGASMSDQVLKNVKKKLRRGGGGAVATPEVVPAVQKRSSLISLAEVLEGTYTCQIALLLWRLQTCEDLRVHAADLGRVRTQLIKDKTQFVRAIRSESALPQVQCTLHSLLIYMTHLLNNKEICTSGSGREEEEFIWFNSVAQHTPGLPPCSVNIQVVPPTVSDTPEVFSVPYGYDLVGGRLIEPLNPCFFFAAAIKATSTGRTYLGVNGVSPHMVRDVAGFCGNNCVEVPVPPQQMAAGQLEEVALKLLGAFHAGWWVAVGHIHDAPLPTEFTALMTKFSAVSEHFVAMTTRTGDAIDLLNFDESTYHEEHLSKILCDVAQLPARGGGGGGGGGGSAERSQSVQSNGSNGTSSPRRCAKVGNIFGALAALNNDNDADKTIQVALPAQTSEKRMLCVALFGAGGGDRNVKLNEESEESDALLNAPIGTQDIAEPSAEDLVIYANALLISSSTATDNVSMLLPKVVSAAVAFPGLLSVEGVTPGPRPYALLSLILKMFFATRVSILRISEVVMCNVLRSVVHRPDTEAAAKGRAIAARIEGKVHDLLHHTPAGPTTALLDAPQQGAERGSTPGADADDGSLAEDVLPQVPESLVAKIALATVRITCGGALCLLGGTRLGKTSVIQYLAKEQQAQVVTFCPNACSAREMFGGEDPVSHVATVGAVPDAITSTQNVDSKARLFIVMDGNPAPFWAHLLLPSFLTASATATQFPNAHLIVESSSLRGCTPGFIGSFVCVFFDEEGGLAPSNAVLWAVQGYIAREVVKIHEDGAGFAKIEFFEVFFKTLQSCLRNYRDAVVRVCAHSIEANLHSSPVSSVRLLYEDIGALLCGFLQGTDHTRFLARRADRAFSQNLVAEVDSLVLWAVAWGVGKSCTRRGRDSIVRCLSEALKGCPQRHAMRLPVAALFETNDAGLPWGSTAVSSLGSDAFCTPNHHSCAHIAALLHLSGRSVLFSGSSFSGKSMLRHNLANFASGEGVLCTLFAADEAHRERADSVEVGGGRVLRFRPGTSGEVDGACTRRGVEFWVHSSGDSTVAARLAEKRNVYRHVLKELRAAQRAEAKDAKDTPRCMVLSVEDVCLSPTTEVDLCEVLREVCSLRVTRDANGRVLSFAGKHGGSVRSRPSLCPVVIGTVRPPTRPWFQNNVFSDVPFLRSNVSIVHSEEADTKAFLLAVVKRQINSAVCGFSPLAHLNMTHHTAIDAFSDMIYSTAQHKNFAVLQPQQLSRVSTSFSLLMSLEKERVGTSTIKNDISRALLKTAFCTQLADEDGMHDWVSNTIDARYRTEGGTTVTTTSTSTPSLSTPSLSVVSVAMPEIGIISIEPTPPPVVSEPSPHLRSDVSGDKEREEMAKERAKVERSCIVVRRSSTVAASFVETVAAMAAVVSQSSVVHARAGSESEFLSSADHLLESTRTVFACVAHTLSLQFFDFASCDVYSLSAAVEGALEHELSCLMFVHHAAIAAPLERLLFKPVLRHARVHPFSALKIVIYGGCSALPASLAHKVTDVTISVDPGRV